MASMAQTQGAEPPTPPPPPVAGQDVDLGQSSSFQSLSIPNIEIPEKLLYWNPPNAVGCLPILALREKWCGASSNFSKTICFCWLASVGLQCKKDKLR